MLRNPRRTRPGDSGRAGSGCFSQGRRTSTAAAQAVRRCPVTVASWYSQPGVVLLDPRQWQAPWWTYSRRCQEYLTSSVSNELAQAANPVIRPAFRAAATSSLPSPVALRMRVLLAPFALAANSASASSSA
jgi:hypothetical protein